MSVEIIIVVDGLGANLQFYNLFTFRLQFFLRGIIVIDF